jgi:hypothetical protein
LNEMTDARTGPHAEGGPVKAESTPGTAEGTPVKGGNEHTPGRDSTLGRTGSRLLPQDECDKLELRLHQAVSGFVDGPREAVEEADQVVEEIAGRFAEAVTRRRRTLRMSWQDGERAEATHSDTEQLRLALRDYRELAERLLRG